VFPLLAATQAAMPLQKLYRRTFGDLVATRTARLLAGMPALLVYIGGAADMVLSVAHVSSGPSLAALALTAVSAWIALRDWRWRLHHLVPAAAGLAAAIITASVPASPGQPGLDPVRGEAFLLAYALIGFGMVIGGLLDHRLLAASFHPPEEAPATRRRLPFAFWLGLSAAASSGVCLWLSERMLDLALPMAVLLGPLVVTYVASLALTVRAFRDLGVRRPDPGAGPRLGFSDDALVVSLVVAVAATIDSALFTAWSPALLALSIGLSGIWLAARNWRERKLDLVWAAAAVITLIAVPRVSSARAFALFVLSMSAALVVQASARAVALPLRSDHVDAI